VLVLLTACGGGGSSGVAPDPPPQFGTFTNPQRVTIVGYGNGDHAMEPFITRDGRYLFFNNSNDPATNTNLHWAERVDDLTFQYRGEIAGVNSAALDGVPSMDTAGNFYFVSTRSYAQSLSTLYRGVYANGTVTGVDLVSGISKVNAGAVNFDAEISPDGNTLYFVDGQFNGGSVPTAAEILIATKQGGTFTRLANAAEIMQQVNSGAGLEYAPAISASGLEIFFTRLEGTNAAIYTATRSSAMAPFGAPRRIQAITGFAEGPSLSPDGKSLYYHLNDNGTFAIYRVTRP
jgi:Tol biopolymer transport system component